MMHALRCFFALVLGVLPLSAQESYEVRFHRPVKTGDRFQIEAKIAVDMATKTIFNADEVEEENLKAACKLTGEVSILATTPKGLAKELELKIATSEGFEDGEARKIFKVGDVISLKHADPDPIVEVNGAEPDPTQAELIDMFLFVQSDDDSTDDELLGPPGKVKPGESWSVNREALLKDWVREGFAGLKLEDLKGSTTLAEVTKLEGNPALRLHGDFKIENTGLQMPHMPEEIRAKRFKLEVKDETDLPVNPADLAARSKTHMNIESDSDGTLEQDGRVTKIRITMRQRSAAEVTVTPKK